MMYGYARCSTNENMQDIKRQTRRSDFLQKLPLDKRTQDIKQYIRAM